MINIASETVVSFNEATQRLPKRRKGKRPHLATLYRWSQRGVKGVRLETIQIGGTQCTSMEALQRFFDRLSRPASPLPLPSQPSMSHAEAEAFCAKAGI